jgi:tetratricopeptide (TPR) repeat protein
VVFPSATSPRRASRTPTSRVSKPARERRPSRRCACSRASSACPWITSRPAGTFAIRSSASFDSPTPSFPFGSERTRPRQNASSGKSSSTQSRRATLSRRPDVYATLGQAYASLGAADRAVAIFEDALQQSIDAAPDDVSVHVRFASLLSYALSDAGDHERAASVVQEALDRARDDADPHNRIRLYWSIARADAIEGRSAEALHYMRKAMSLLEATDNTTQLARGYLLSAGITSRERRAAETRDHLRQAKLLLGPSPESLDLGMLRVGQSRLAALEGDGDTAVTRARQALDILGDFYGDSQGAAVAALAEGLALQGDTVGANDAFRRAVDLLTVHGRRHDAAESCVRWAEMLEAAGRTEDAARARQRAADLGLASDEVKAARKN